MKKIMKVFVLVAAAAMALASCQKPEVDNPNPQEYEYTFLLGSADTKAVIGENSVEWENGDQIGIYAVTTSGVSANKYGAVTPGPPAKMVVYSENALTVGDMVYAYFPRIGTNADTPDAVKMSIPSAQDGKNDMPMVSLPLEMETEWKANDNETSASGLIKFCNVGSVIEFNVYSTESEYRSEKIQSVSFIADKSIAGDFEMNMEAVDGTDATLAVELTNGSKEVVFTLSTPAEVPAEKSSAAKINMVVAPGTYTGTVVVKTDVATYTYEISTAKDFARSAVKPLGVNLATGEREAETKFTWDLTKKSYESASTEKVEWVSEFVNLTLERGEGNEAANAYLGGDNAHTRVYQKHIMTFDPLGKYQIESVEFNVTESSYVEKLTNSTWTNGEVSNKGTIVTVIPTDGHKNVAVTIGAATRFTGITVYYSYDEDYVLPTVKSLTVSGQTLEFVQNTEFDFDGTVTATYTDDTTLDVTDKVTTSSPDMTTTGTKEVTVSYTEGGKTYTTSYEIEVIEASALSGWIETSFADLKGGDQVVIVGIKSSTHYAMSDDKGTSSGPLPVNVTTSGDKLSEEPAESIVWIVGVNGDNRIFYADATKETWLYCTNTNNGVRVGTNDANAFAWDKDYLKHVGTSRYLGIYNTQDWRCYTSSTATNIANQSFKFYVKVGGGETTEPDPTPAPVELMMSDVICSDQTETSLTFTWDAVEGASSYQVYFDSVDKGTITATSYTASGLTAGTSHTIAVKAVGDGVNYNTSASAKTCTASTKTAQGEGEGTTVTLTIKATAGTKSSDGKSISWTQDGFTVTNTQANGSTAIRTSDSDHYRVYQGSLLNFTSSNKTFNKVEVTCTSSSYATVLKTSATNAGLTATVSGSVVTITTSNPTTAMPTITMSAQSRINKVVVELN